MTDIDLTPMNDAAARELYAWDYSVAVMRHVAPDTPPEARAKHRVAARESGRSLWDSGDVPADLMHDYREKALAATLTAWRTVAAQGWDACVGELAEDEDRDDRSVDRLRYANPYREETPDD